MIWENRPPFVCFGVVFRPLTMTSTNAARTNLTSNNVSIHDEIVGIGVFRIAYAGTYIGGNRNQQEAVCKKFKPQYHVLENEFFASDFQIADKAIDLALDWNNMCEDKKGILITKGSVMSRHGTKYTVEPLIRYFTKFTSNNGWIASDADLGWPVLAMEAFSHYTYHRTGGQLIVCDLQGRYRNDTYSRDRCRFELTDVAICSRKRNYGPTDLGEKGIESFFAGHQCNQFCHRDGHWTSPRAPRQWFEASSNSSMMRSSSADLLSTKNRARFTSTLDAIYDDSDDEDS